MGWVDKITFGSLYPRERDSVPIVQEAGWAPRAVWADAELPSPTEIRYPDRPARSESHAHRRVLHEMEVLCTSCTSAFFRYKQLCAVVFM
jgi:hypothetical protein